MLAAFQYQFVGMLLMHRVQITIFLCYLSDSGNDIAGNVRHNNRSQIMMQMLA